MKNRSGLAIALSCTLAWMPALVKAATPQELLETIKSVGPEGTGNVEAGQAVRELTDAEATSLPVLLRALDDASPIAANWIRGAFEAIADRELRAGRPLPVDQLEAFIQDRSHAPRARRLAFEWLRRTDPSADERLIPGMLDDPSAEFRRDAVGRLLEQAAELDQQSHKEEWLALYRKALSGAVDKDQVQAIVEPLKEMGVQVDLQKHFGFVPDWHVIGPFDNRERIGFAAIYPPERELELTSTYEGQTGEVSWSALNTSDEYGLVDIAKQVGPYKGAVMYAVSDFDSPKKQPVQIRLGTPNAWKLWLNGRLLFGQEEYHRGTAMDQYRVDAVLRSGRNRILLKVCQNEQPEDWAQRYQFQLRVCRESGSAVLPQPPQDAALNRPNSSDRRLVRGE